jgi:hypothetical protein
MNTLFQADKPSIGRRVLLVVAGVMVVGGALLVAIVMFLRVASGR